MARVILLTVGEFFLRVLNAFAEPGATGDCIKMNERVIVIRCREDNPKVCKISYLYRTPKNTFLSPIETFEGRWDSYRSGVHSPNHKIK